VIVCAGRRHSGRIMAGECPRPGRARGRDQPPRRQAQGL